MYSNEKPPWGGGTQSRLALARKGGTARGLDGSPSPYQSINREFIGSGLMLLLVNFGTNEISFILSMFAILGDDIFSSYGKKYKVVS